MFPKKKPELDNTQNLDLNTTARKNERTIEKFSPYLNNATYAVIQANLSYPIDAFDSAAELAAATATEEESKAQPKADMKKSSKELMESQPATSVANIEPDVVAPEPILDINGPIFERIVIIVPYKCPETVKHIEAMFERINLAGLNLENARYLNTKELTEAERSDRSLDFLGGFELMDSEFRMFIIEGLGGRGHSMD